MKTKIYLSAILIIVAGFIFFGLSWPLYDNIKALKIAIADREGQYKDRKEIIDMISKLTQDYKDHSADISRFSIIVPKEKDSAELVSMVQAMASQNGLQLNSLKLLQPIDNQGKDSYYTEGIDMNLVGNYPSLKSFLYSVEKNIRILDVQAITGSPVAPNSNLINFNVKVNAYYLK
jgi:Tfp pilus assembly protein PilO